MTDDRGLPTSDSEHKSHELETNDWEQNRQARDEEAAFAASRWVLLRWGKSEELKLRPRTGNEKVVLAVAPPSPPVGATSPLVRIGVSGRPSRWGGSTARFLVRDDTFGDGGDITAEHDDDLGKGGPHVYTYKILS